MHALNALDSFGMKVIFYLQVAAKPRLPQTVKPVTQPLVSGILKKR